LSGDAAQEYFADGMTEDLITDLSKISALSVIARSSAFAYKGKTPKIPVIARALGVTHIVVGSVRQSGNRVRIDVKLIDASTGKHLWAERYDRQLRDIFALEDEVRGKIIKALSVKLTALEQKRAALKATTSVEAYDLLMKGRYQEGSFSKQGNARAISFYRQAVALDPEFAEAYARMANMYDLRSRFGWSDDIGGDRKRALQFARKAIALDANDPYSYWTLGRILSREQDESGGSLSESVIALERAITLNPNYADAYAYLSLLYLGVGKPDEAHSAIQTAMRLNPRYPFWYIRNRGLIYYMEEKYSPAIADLEQSVEQNPTTFIGRWWLAAAYAQAGRQEDAAWQMEEIRVLREEFTIQQILDLSIIHYPPYVERLTAGLRKAGGRD
jgi:adenylate cyclase